MDKKEEVKMQMLALLRDIMSIILLIVIKRLLLYRLEFILERLNRHIHSKELSIIYCQIVMRPEPFDKIT